MTILCKLYLFWVEDDGGGVVVELNTRCIVSQMIAGLINIGQMHIQFNILFIMCHTF